MQALLPWLSILVVIVAGWMLIKRVQTHMTLLGMRVRKMDLIDRPC